MSCRRSALRSNRTARPKQRNVQAPLPRRRIDCHAARPQDSQDDARRVRRSRPWSLASLVYSGISDSFAGGRPSNAILCAPDWENGQCPTRLSSDRRPEKRSAQESCHRDDRTARQADPGSVSSARYVANRSNEISWSSRFNSHATARRLALTAVTFTSVALPRGNSSEPRVDLAQVSSPPSS
jgi:hypothetical protein